jgi:hypothetical protein
LMAPAEPATSDPALRTGFYWMNKQKEICFIAQLRQNVS